MKRGLVLTLAALALVVGSGAAQAAVVDLSLNLRYTNPSQPAQGGRWFLLAKTDGTFGLGGVSVNLNNVNTAGIALGNPTAVGSGPAAYATMAATVTNSIANGGNPYAGLIGSSVNVVWGQDVSSSVVANIGKGAGTAGNLTVDPLRNAAWANSALLVSGTFGATRPTFAAGTAANVLGAATPGTAAVAATTVNTVVRGDSLKTLNLEPNGGGLLFGDLNRNGTVGFTTDINPALSQIGTGSGKTWDTGDFNGNGSVGFTTDINPALANIGVPAPPAPVSAVPEPATLGLIGFGLASMVAVRRRK